MPKLPLFVRRLCQLLGDTRGAETAEWVVCACCLVGGGAAVLPSVTEGTNETGGQYVSLIRNFEAQPGQAGGGGGRGGGPGPAGQEGSGGGRGGGPGPGAQGGGPPSTTTQASTVGAPGFLEGLIPVWGSGRDSINAYQEGRWIFGTVMLGMAVTDVVPIKALGTAIVKGVGKLIFKEVVQEGAEVLVKEGVETLAKEGAETVVREGAETAAKEGAGTVAGTARNAVVDATRPGFVRQPPDGWYGPYHRLESPTQGADVAARQTSGGELWGSGYRGSSPKAQAYDGPLPSGQRGVEFYSRAPPNRGDPPGRVSWSGDRPGVRTDGDFGKAEISVTVNTQIPPVR